MSLLPTTPGFFQRGIQTLTGLFRKSEPQHPLRGIQAQAEVNNAVIDDNHDLKKAVIENLNNLAVDKSNATEEATQKEVFLGINENINNKIAEVVAQDKTEEDYEAEQNRIFSDEFQRLILAYNSERSVQVSYIDLCNQTVMADIKSMLDSCFYTQDEKNRLLPLLPDTNYAVLRDDFFSKCSNLAVGSVGRVTDSWLSDLKLPAPVEWRGPEVTKNQPFFKRTALYLDALKAYNIFNTPMWRNYKLLETARMSGPLRYPLPFWSIQYERDWKEEWAKKPPSLPLSPPPPPPPPPGGPANPGYDFRTYIPPYYYVVGPIVDFEKLEGRTLIYVKCYDDNTFTTGIYFWVYLSQSEGLFRVFFKLSASSIIEKGFDYTQGTLVDFRLQGILSSYYFKHYSWGKQAPVKLDSLQRVLYFVENMPYLQSSFLNNFPLPIILPCSPPVQQGCCYVGIPPLPHTVDSLNRPQGLLGHYYLIDKKYNAIFSKGFPLVPGEINDFFPPLLPRDVVNPDNRYCREQLIIESGPVSNRPVETNIFKDFLKANGTQLFTISEPLIYCFTTSCPKTTLVSFGDLLNVMNYTATVWFQGLQNFTRMFNGMLSPVLYIVIGATVEKPDFELSSIRDEMLGLRAATPLSIAKNHFNNCSSMLMTLGTEGFRNVDPLPLLPGLNPSARQSAVAASKNVMVFPGQYQVSQSKLSIVVESINRQKEFVKENIVDKILGKQIPLTLQPMLDKFNTVDKFNTQPTNRYFIDELIDFGLLSIKRKWLYLMFNNAYKAQTSVFPDEIEPNTVRLYGLCGNNKFLLLPDLNCLDPDDERLQTLPSMFNETRMDYDDHASGEVNVVVSTLAQQYCMEFPYDEQTTLETSTPRRMCVMFQLSSTIVYTVASAAAPYNKIVYAINMQKTPTACLPEYKIPTTTREELQSFAEQARLAGQGGGGKGKTDKQLKAEILKLKKAEEAAAARQRATAATAATVTVTLGKEKVHSKAGTGKGKGKPVQVPSKPVTTKPSQLPVDIDDDGDDEMERVTARQPNGDDDGDGEGMTGEVKFTKQEHEERNQLEAVKLEAARGENFLFEKIHNVLLTDNTICSTPKRVSSWGAFFAGKMMEYLFGPYFQLPTLFKRFAPWLQVCHAYFTTALIYNYNRARPYVFFNTAPGGTSYSFAALFIKHFQETGFTFVPPTPPGAAVPPTPLDYVRQRLNEHTAAIREISFFTAPFMNDISETELDSSPSSSVSSWSESVSSSVGHEYVQLFGPITTPTTSSDSSGRSYKPSGSSQGSSQGSSPGLSQRSSLSPGGGSLITNKSTNRCKTKRKNRKTTRKNRKVNRMVKKHNTKYKTYKRKANGRKLKGNNHKNNKTMRRYRRVRK